MRSTTPTGARQLIGALLLVGTLLTSAAPRAEARPPAPPRYFQGTLRGSDLTGWTLWLATNGTKAYGVAFGEGGISKTGSFGGARLEGTVRGSSVTLAVFPVSQEDIRHSIGTVRGTLSRQGALNGSFTFAGRQGSFTTTPVGADRGGTSDMVGEYVAVRRPRSHSNINLKLLGSGEFSVEGKIDGTPVGRITGRWFVDTGGSIWFLPLSLIEDNNFFTLTLKLKIPLKLEIHDDGDDVTFFLPEFGTELFTLHRI